MSIHFGREHKNKSHSNVLDKPTINANNNRTLTVRPSNVDETYCLLKILEKIGNKRPLHIISISPDQYPNYIADDGIESMDKFRDWL